MPRSWRWCRNHAGHGLVGIGALLAYVFVALMPFEWEPPRLVVNRVERADGLVRFAEPGILVTEGPPAWVARAMETQAFTLRVRARSFARGQSGPVRIFSVSRDHGWRNVMVAQEGDDLIVRLRMPGRDRHGMPSLRVAGVFAESAWRTIVLAVGDGSVTIEVDGREALREETTAAPLADWDRGLPLVLGNEGTWQRPWRGEIAEASVLAGGVRYDCLAEEFARPDRRWLGIKYELWSWSEPLDFALNLLCFIPVGWLLARAHGPRRALLTIAVLCLAIEVLQVAFRFRLPSLRDWLLNVAGAALGAFGGRRPGGT